MEAKCAMCGVYKCRKGEFKNLPKFCPMADEELYKKAREIVRSEEFNKFYVECSKIEKAGYLEWPRVRETIEFIKAMDYKKTGLAFCGGFIKEASILTEIFNHHGVELVSAMCKTGGIDKTELGLGDTDKLKENEFEAGCNPVAQAFVLNKENTDFNIVMGLCVGHDSLFYKHTEALCTTLVVKDRVTGHNPAIALYGADGYFRKKLYDD